MMNLCATQQKALSSMEETKRSVLIPVSDGRADDVFCPKPRRFNILNPSINEQPSRPLRRNFGHHTESELCDSTKRIDLLDILRLKGGCAGEQSAMPDSSPHFMCGSPPSRVANPLIQDVRFGDEKVTSFLKLSPIIHRISDQSLASSPARNASSIRSNFGNNPAVSVEGFDCLERERGNCSILTSA